MANPTEPVPSLPKEQPAFLPLVFVPIFGIGWVVGSFLFSLDPPVLVLWFAFLLLLSLTATILDLRRSLPAQNIISVIGLASLVSVVIEIVNAKTGLPFGQSDWLDMFGTPAFHLVRWPVPLIVVVNLLNSRGVARLLLVRWRSVSNYGLLSLGLTVLLTTLSNLGLEHFETVDLWFALGIHILIAAGILLVVTPWLIIKRPGPISTPGFFPLIIWFMLLGVLFGHS